MTFNRRILPVGTVITGLLAAGAVAATPDKGSVSFAAPKIKWTGEVTASYSNRVALLVAEQAGGGSEVPCNSGQCDSFMLTVADVGDVTVTADAPDEASVTIRIFKPDGSAVITTGDAAPKKPVKVKLANAAKGDYKIEYFNNYVDGPVAYNADASLVPVGGAPAPSGSPGPGGDTPPPSGTTPPPPGSAPPPKQDFSFTVTAPKLSAKKVSKAKKFAVAFKVSREVAKVTMQLKKGKKTVAKGALGKTSGGKVTLKASKLKAGIYTLVAQAVDSGGTSVSRTLKVKVKK